MNWEDVALRLTLTEAAQVARESRQTLWRRHKTGKLRTTQHGRTIMVSREALMEYCGVPHDESPTVSGASVSVLSPSQNGEVAP